MEAPPTNQTPTTSQMFRAGGTLHLTDTSYVRRPADDDLLTQVLNGQFCSILTARQMGKSSLVLRTAVALQQAGIRTATIDLSKLGTVLERDQWYRGVLEDLATKLALSVDVKQWWEAQGSLGPVQRFTSFLREVVLTEIAQPVVIFVDEIDSTLRLDFTDDFFAAIRSTYNQRATNEQYTRLTFVLLGVAAPNDLIKDATRTPFNIGTAIDLQEFTRDDAQPLQQGLEQCFPGQGAVILNRIFHWTNGHPYLTQKLCAEVVAAPGDTSWSDQQIDDLVARLFFAEAAHSDDNLKFVQRSLEERPDCRPLLLLYRRVHAGASITEDERSLHQNRLKLIGLVRAHGKQLCVRNAIYRRVFDLAWVKERMPVNWTRRVTIGAGAVSLLLILFLVGFIPYQQQQKRIANTNTFRSLSDPDVKIMFLNGLCDEQQEEAQHLFYEEQDLDAQVAMFRKAAAHEMPDTLRHLARCLYPPPHEWKSQSDYQDQLTDAMCDALCHAPPKDGRRAPPPGSLECDCKEYTDGW